MNGIFGGGTIKNNGKKFSPPVFQRTNIIYPKAVFLDVRPPLENVLKEDEYLKNLKPREAFAHVPSDIIYENMRPVITVMRIMSGFPFQRTPSGFFYFRVSTPAMLYSVILYLLIFVYVVWVLMQRINIKQADGKKLEGAVEKFEEAVIAYLFFVYLLPIFMVPIIWYETGKITSILNDCRKFEDLYIQTAAKELPLDIKRKSSLVAILLPVLSIACCVVIHSTMIEFRILQVIPYCFLTIVTYILGGFWYLICEVIGKTANILADDFHRALKNVGPASYVAEYRALWLRLSNLTRNTGVSLCYSLIFLSLYLFLAITLSIYGLLSQIQEGLGTKDIGLTLTAVSSIGLLFYICDEAHYASQNVRSLFQKRLLAVELSWMNNDAQLEINMFLKATDLNPSNLSIGGFFDVNRSLFKSLLATMVTYLVVLLQFQISIPDSDTPDNSTTRAMATTIATV